MADWSHRLDRLVTPARRRGAEILDDPSLDWSLRRRSHRDIELSNQWLGGLRTLETGVRDALAEAPGSPPIVLDVGAGAGATLTLVRRIADELPRPILTVALDINAQLAGAAGPGGFGICGSVLALPLRSKSVDVVTCSLLLHHFDTDELPAVIRELDRVARHRVVIHDLRRSWLAVAGLWSASFALAFHPISRHDGMLSILRGFTPGDLESLIHGVTGAEVSVARHWAFRLLASWRPRCLALHETAPSV